MKLSRERIIECLSLEGTHNNDQTAMNKCVCFAYYRQIVCLKYQYFY